MQLVFIEPRAHAGRYKAGVTYYGGRRHRVALFTLDGHTVELGLPDTRRAAVDLGAAEAVLRAVAGRLEVPVAGVETAATQLQGHCKTITGWKPREPRR